jgi:hypothetical protein
MLAKRNFFACLHEDTNSLRLFKVANSGLHIIKYFVFFPQTEITSIRSRAVGFEYLLRLNILCKGWSAGNSSSMILVKNVCPIFVDTFLLNGGLYHMIFRLRFRVWVVV